MIEKLKSGPTIFVRMTVRLKFKSFIGQNLLSYNLLGRTVTTTRTT